MNVKDHTKNEFVKMLESIWKRRLVDLGFPPYIKFRYYNPLSAALKKIQEQDEVV